jgi:putative phosphoesterase
MKIAILSDVHGNAVALDAVLDDVRRQTPDLIVHGGDLVFNGPRPADVVDRVRELGWPGVVGNTDEMLWVGSEVAPPASRPLFDVLRSYAADRLGPERIAWLRELPREWRHERLLLVHATSENLWQSPEAAAPDDELAAPYRDLGADVVVYCHIHHPFVRRIGSLTIANSGSVGWPLDGDWRPSYLLVEDGHVAVRRVAYDLEQEIRELTAANFPARSWLAAVHRNGRRTAPLALDPPRSS